MGLADDPGGLDAEYTRDVVRIMNIRLLLCLFCLGCIPDLPDAPAPQSEPRYVFTTTRLQPVSRTEPLPEIPSVKPRRWVAFFTSEHCSPCRTVKREVFPELVKRGLKVSDQRGADVLIIDVDKRPEMLGRHKVDTLPCWIFCDEQVETSREVGAMDADEVQQMLRGK